MARLNIIDTVRSLLETEPTPRQMTMATIRKGDSILTHQWEVEDRAKQTEDGVVIDGYLIEDATIEGVEQLP